MPHRRPLLVVLVVVLAVMTWVGSPSTVLPRTGSPPPPRPSPDGAANAPPPTTPLPSPPAPPPPAITPPPDDILVIEYRIDVRSPDPSVADALEVIPTVLEDPRGWQQAAIDFRQTPDAPFTIAVVEGDEAQSLCQPYDVGGRFSCQNGPLVVLNAIRWREGVDHWPGDLASYRTMLVNHEVGHLIGMHHLRCAGDGQVAPVMEQQSGTLRGCQANPWPTAVELRLAATHQFAIAPDPLDVPFEQ